MPRDLLSQLERYRDPKADNFDLTLRFNFEEETLLGNFFDNVGVLRKNLHEFRAKIDEVKELHSFILTSVLASEETELMKDTVDKQQESALRKDDAIIRIKTTQYETMNRQFYLLLAEYNTCQSAFKDSSKLRIRRQFEIAGFAISEEEIENYIESGSIVLQQGIFSDTEQAKMALAEIEARHNDIMKLEKTISELAELFKEIAILVQSQGEMIDRIEYNVGLTKDYVEESTIHLKKAGEYQKSARKKKIIIAAVVVVIILIIVIAVAVSVSTKK
ncbi:Syntaxin-1A [Cichlidogyrus casuarinus]|uniref:Syntaxin-1A n=1 Tax=Cichlidogyrus casuarinus TaxID=1844966 RepID=A0ABD2QNL6_9PLAT